VKDAIVFLAALAGNNTSARWLTVGRDGDCKLSLEVPASELAQVLRLAALGDKTLKVTVEVDS